MKLTILTENTAGGKFLAEHGLSYLVEVDGERILFDAGHTDVFLKNAGKLGIDIHNAVEKVVLSHGHWDHGDGLQFLNGKTLYTHPAAFMKRYHKTDHSPVGLSFPKADLENKFKIVETKVPVQITENLWFLGEIPRGNDFESQTTSFADEYGNPDFIPDDSAMAAVLSNELVVITGCSHSGICNITEYAKKVTGITSVKAVIGGFHLKFHDRQTKQTIEYFKRNRVKQLYPSHCTQLPALAAFYNDFNIGQIKSGMQFEF